MNNIIRKQKEIYNHYGEKHQWKKLKEECLELGLAIEHGDENILEETADVLNVIEQLMDNNPYVKEGIIAWINYKTDREISRIKNRIMK